MAEGRGKGDVICGKGPNELAFGHCLLLREGVRFGWSRVSTEGLGFGLGPTGNILEYKDI